MPFLNSETAKKDNAVFLKPVGNTTYGTVLTGRKCDVSTVPRSNTSQASSGLMVFSASRSRLQLTRPLSLANQTFVCTLTEEHVRENYAG